MATRSTSIASPILFTKGYTQDSVIIYLVKYGLGIRLESCRDRMRRPAMTSWLASYVPAFSSPALPA